MAAAIERARGALTEIAGKWPWFAGLGAVLIFFSLIVFFNITATTLATIWLIGFLLLLGGVATLIHALFTESWSQTLTGVIGGALYIFGGAMIMREPAAGSVLITLLATLALTASGIARVVIALRHRDIAGWWVVLLGGVASMVIGVLLIASLPWSGAWVLGVLIGSELAVQGISWVAFGLGLRAVKTRLTATA